MRPLSVTKIKSTQITVTKPLKALPKNFPHTSTPKYQRNVIRSRTPSAIATRSSNHGQRAPNYKSTAPTPELRLSQRSLHRVLHPRKKTKIAKRTQFSTGYLIASNQKLLKQGFPKKAKKNPKNTSKSPKKHRKNAKIRCPYRSYRANETMERPPA
jgi:hypothetical protein